MGFDSVWHYLILVFVLGSSVVYVIPIWRIVNKAGFQGVLALLMFVPVVNIIMLWVFAFVKWPVERDASKQFI